MQLKNNNSGVIGRIDSMIFSGDHTIFHLGLFNFCAFVLSKVAKRKLAVLDDKVYTLLFLKNVLSLCV